ncbi:MAG: hypothetical protein GY924_27480 [Planctomycetaceae bacterium]|nr:hypothetical protein [Planctomycetaceae bacterium]
MLIAAGLAGTGAFYYAQSAIKSTDFIRSIQLISHGDDAEWCRLANGQTVQGTSGAYFCAVPMPKFQELVEDDAVGE